MWHRSVQWSHRFNGSRLNTPSRGRQIRQRSDCGRWTDGDLDAILVGSSVDCSVPRSVRQLADVIRQLQEMITLYRRAEAGTNDDIGVVSKALAVAPNPFTN